MNEDVFSRYHKTTIDFSMFVGYGHDPTSLSCREAADACVLPVQAPHSALPAPPEPIPPLLVQAHDTRFVSQMPRNPMVESVVESFGGALEVLRWISGLNCMF